LAIGLEAGDLVAMTGNAGGYSAVAALSIGAVPAWFDVRPNGQANVDSFVELVSEAARASKSVKAVVITHLFGQMADVGAIVREAEKHGIKVIEDCAQALGAKVDEHLAGTLSDIATLSFYPTKNLGALGDAGAVVTKSNFLAGRVKSLKQYGWSQKYHNTEPLGFNSRLDEIQAAFLRVKFPMLDQWNVRRVEIMRSFDEAAPSWLERVIDFEVGYNGHLAPFKALLGERTKVRAWFTDLGIATEVHYPLADFDQVGLSGLRLVSLSETSDFCQRVFSLPLFPHLTSDEVSAITRGLARLNG
jgi:aminotransferase EvaB